MAKSGEDFDDLFKSLISCFFRFYLELFHRDLLAILNVEDADWSNTELRFPDFGKPTRSSSKKAKRFADIVAKVPYLDPENPPFKGTKYFVMDIEPEKGSISDLRPRMPIYRLGLKMAHPDAHVVVTGLYLDVGLSGLGTDWLLSGDLGLISASVKSKARPDVANPPTLTDNAEAFSWSYVGLPGLDAELYIPMAKTNPLVPALIGFMRMDAARRLELLDEAILAIDGHDLEIERKNLLARGLLAGLDLSDDEWNRFQEMVGRRNESRRTDAVIKTWYDQGKDAGLKEGRKKGRLEGRHEGILEGRKEGVLEGRKEGVLEGRRDGFQRMVLNLISQRFGSSERVENAVSKLNENQLQDLAMALLDPSKTLEDLNLVEKRGSVKKKIKSS